MRRFIKRGAWLGFLAAFAAVVVSACGSSTSTTPSTASTSTTATTGASTTPGTGSGSKVEGTLSMTMGTAPQSLDPGLDYTTQGSEVNWLVYTGLTTYSRAGGTGSTKLIPGLTTALPVISDSGKTYTFTLRKGLKFSDGKPVVASDFTYTVERSIKIPWGGSGTFITPIIEGASAYAAGKSKTISGITTDNSTGKIVIHLTQAYGPFANVLAFPALGIIPTGTSFKALPTDPPPGVGPYKVTNIVANQSFDVVKNPIWDKLNVPGIPDGYDNVDVKINSNVDANALATLNNTNDIFDWSDTVPGTLISQINSQASDRYNLANLGGSVYYVFMNTTKAPFNNQLVREAVVTGLNQNAMNRLGSGTLEPTCHFLPAAIPGHTDAPCPYGTPGNGNLAKAKALIKQSGMEGAKVTVYSEERAPRQQWMTYYTQFLNQIGLKASVRLVADANYFTVIGESKKVDPQTGFADWNQDFPNPIDFYGVLLDGKAILPTSNENFGQTNDPVINAAIQKLGSVPTAQLGTVAAQWQTVEKYLAKKAYIAPFGYQKFPFFTSDKVASNPNAISDIYGWDLSELQMASGS